MELESLYYFTELAKDLNMTRTANRLFLSQQTLSNHIQRLEKSYGMALLYRRPTLSLTPAGREVLQTAERLVREERNLREVLTDIEKEERGTIRLGASMMRQDTMLTAVLPKYAARYPGVNFRLISGVSRDLEAMIIKDELDVAISVLGGSEALLERRRLMAEKVYFCTNRSLLERLYTEEEVAQILQGSAEGINVAQVARLPFCLLDNQVGVRIRQCFQDEGLQPQVFLTSTYTEVGLAICAQGTAACFVPHFSLLRSELRFREDMIFLPLQGRSGPVVQEVSLVMARDRYHPRYLTDFCNFTEEFLVRMSAQEPAMLRK